MKKSIVLYQGAFDILNWGHVQGFKFAKEHGDYLIIALNTDNLIRNYKHREPVVPYEERKAIIEAVRYVDEVVPAGMFSPIVLLEKYNVDVFIVAEEWLDGKTEEFAYMHSKGGKVVIAPRFAKTSSTEIRKRLLACLDAAS